MLTALCAFFLFTVTFTAAACNGGPAKPEPVPGPTPGPRVEEPTPGPTQPKPTVRVDVADFVADKRKHRETKEVLGPLESYKLHIEFAMDANKTAILTEGKLVGEAVVFGIPDGKGDTGALYEATLEKVADLVLSGALPAAVQNEYIRPGNIALVRLETPGFPSGRKAGETIPVTIAPLGNAESVVGGHVYPVTLACHKTNEALAVCDYKILAPEIVEERETYFRRLKFDEVFDQAATQPATPGAGPGPTPGPGPGPVPSEAKTDGATPEAPVRPTRRLRRFVLSEGFRLARDTSFSEPGRSQIELFLYSSTEAGSASSRHAAALADDEVAEGVYQKLKDNRFDFFVARDPRDIRRITIVPKLVPGESLESLYDLIRAARFDLKPKRHLHVIADNQNGRIIIAGPGNLRKLLGSLEYTFDPADQRIYRPSGNFRLIATPSADRSRLTVQWSRFERGNKVGEGREEIANDVGDLIRAAYRNGASPDDCLLMVEKARDRSLISAKLMFYPAAVRPRIDE